MNAFFVSMAVVAVAEIGDKTQILAIMLAARHRRRLPIILGMLVATLANHAVAASIGAYVAELLGPEILRWLLGGSFIAMALWCLVPDKVDDTPRLSNRTGIFVSTVIAFFLLEIGDKTQLATLALAARFHGLGPVIAGTTTGMMLVDVPAVLFGEAIGRRIPLWLMRLVAATMFAILGGLVLLNPGGNLVAG